MALSPTGGQLRKRLSHEELVLAQGLSLQHRYPLVSRRLPLSYPPAYGLGLDRKNRAACPTNDAIRLRVRNMASEAFPLLRADDDQIRICL